MDAQELRNLQEGYLGVYIQEEVDLWVSELVEDGYDIDEYNDEELLEAFLDERKNEDPKSIAHKAGINKPDAWGPPTKFGQEATRNSLASGIRGVRRLQQAGVRINRHHRNKYLAHKVHQGWAKAAKNSPHQTPEQRTRRSKLINPDLQSFRKNLPKNERDKDVPFVKKAERAANKQGEFAENYDLYDIILSHLLDEGYAETVEAAEVMMVNMSEEWRESICEELTGERRKRALEKGTPLANRVARAKEGQPRERTGPPYLGATKNAPIKRGGIGDRGRGKSEWTGYESDRGSGNKAARRAGKKVRDTSDEL